MRHWSPKKLHKKDALLAVNAISYVYNLIDTILETGTWVVLRVKHIVVKQLQLSVLGAETFLIRWRRLSSQTSFHWCNPQIYYSRNKSPPQDVTWLKHLLCIRGPSMTGFDAKFLSYLNSFYDNAEINIKICFLLYSGNYWVKITNRFSVYPRVKLCANEPNAHVACLYFFIFVYVCSYVAIT